jgi:uncharacterized membrane protein YphA (DoxX/SURF4 family)
VNTALLVLRLVPGMLLIGHGLQKLGPAKCSPRLLHAVGHKAIATASSNSIFGEGSRLRCSLGRLRSLGPLARRGTFTPVGTILIGADMTTAILTVRARHGIGARGRLRVPARPDGRRLRHYGVGRRLLLDQRMAHVNNWAGIHNWPMSDVARAGISLAVGVVGGLLMVIASRLAARSRGDTNMPTTG